jgi:hypothetical protein
MFRKLWRIVKPVVTLGLPILINHIRRKNPQSNTIAIAAQIIEAILHDRPDLYRTPGLYDAARRYVQEGNMPEKQKRELIAQLFKMVG